jgi:uncharacterized protein (DUF58 family)
MSASQTKRQGSQCVVVTLPELLSLANSAKHLSLSALRSNVQGGQHESRFLGRGMVFAESRLYQSGDDIRTIDWRVTARTGKAHTKLFSVEKERQVLLGVDMRSTMFFATQGVFKSVQTALLMSYIGWNAIQAGNRLGGLIFDDENLSEFRPALGKKGVLPFLHALAESSILKAKSGRGASESTLDHAIDNLARVAAPGSLIFLASDFRFLSKYGQEALLKLSKHTDICLCFIYDPFEAALPRNGHYPITDGEADMRLDTYAKGSMEEYQRQFVERRRKVRSLALNRHIFFMECSTAEDCFEMLKKHFTLISKARR